MTSAEEKEREELAAAETCAAEQFELATGLPWAEAPETVRTVAVGAAARAAREAKPRPPEYTITGGPLAVARDQFNSQQAQRQATIPPGML